MHLAILMLFSMILVSSITGTVYGQISNAKPSLSWYIDNFVHEINLIIHFNPDKKAEIINNHINNIQVKINEKIENHEPVPIEFEERRLQKVEALEIAIGKIDANQDNISAEKSNALTTLKTQLTNSVESLKSLKDINEIRICVSDFSKLNDPRNWDFAGGNIQQETLANQIDERCNNLDSAKRLCQGRIDSLDLAFSDKPYENLAELCPALQSIPLTKIRSLLYGD